jgi:hypothetical protein
MGWGRSRRSLRDVSAVIARNPSRRGNPESFRGGSLDCFRCARNDGGWGTISFFQFTSQLRMHHHILAASSARVLQSSRPPEDQEGAGKAGRRLAPAIPCADQTRTGGSQVTPGHPGLPCANGFNGVLRALPGERCTIAPVAMQMADARARSDSTHHYKT